MGTDGQKPQAPQQKDSNDIILDLRLSKKRLEADSKRSLKESEKNIAKAKQALAKNNEEGAKLFLQTAMTKKQEATNLQKMAQKIDYVESQVKHSQANQEMMGQLNRITPIMNQYCQNMSTEQIYSNMTQFENVLDDMMVQGRVMDNMMNKNQGDYQTDMQVDSMLAQMRQEEQIKLQDLNPQNVQFQNLPQQQQQYYPQQQQQQQQQF